MPLEFNTTSQTVASLIDEIRGLKGDYESATCRLDAMTSRLLALPNDQLAAFGNYLGPADSNLETSLATSGTNATVNIVSLGVPSTVGSTNLALVCKSQRHRISLRNLTQ